MSIETPKYKLIKSDKKFSVRQYEKHIEAKVFVISDSHSSAGSYGFGLLADFIFGNNKKNSSISMTAPVSSREFKSEKIAMTAPVSTSKQKGKSYTVTFIMPSKYKLSTLPKPNNSDVLIAEVAPHQEVALSFSGLATEGKIINKINELLNWAESQSLKVTGEAIVSRFDPPWKPGIFRHNEVSFILAS